MAIRAKKPKGEDAALDLTSMIDVVFLLLIFFMVATKFKEVERLMDAYLPKDAGGPPKENKEEKEEIRIQLGKGEPDKPAIFVNKVFVSDFEALYRKLLELSAVLEDAPVIMEPKPDVEFNAVIQTLNACSRAKIEKVSFSQPPMVIEGVNDGRGGRSGKK